jgi:hypothetical protein
MNDSFHVALKDFSLIVSMKFYSFKSMKAKINGRNLKDHRKLAKGVYNERHLPFA